MMTVKNNVIIVMDSDMYTKFMTFCGEAVVVSKRGPTAYNKFIGTALRKIAEQFPEMPRNLRMKKAQELYRQSKTKQHDNNQ